jgi:hypothetical protein
MAGRGEAPPARGAGGRGERGGMEAGPNWERACARNKCLLRHKKGDGSSTLLSHRRTKTDDSHFTLPVFTLLPGWCVFLVRLADLSSLRCTFLHVHHEDFRRSRPCYPRWCLCVLREQVHTQISWPEECCSNQCPPQCWQEHDDGGCVRDQLLDLLFVYYCCILT